MTGAQDHTGDRAGIYVQVYASTAYALMLLWLPKAQLLRFLPV